MEEFQRESILDIPITRDAKKNETTVTLQYIIKKCANMANVFGNVQSC